MYNVRVTKQSKTVRDSMTIGEQICAKMLESRTSDFHVTEVNVGETGRVSFRVKLFDLCGGDKVLIDLISLNKSASHVDQFSVDSIGELLLRKHMEDFVKEIVNMTPLIYNKNLLPFNHLHFTIRKVNELYEFTFHVSLLHDVLLELFYGNVEGEKEDGDGHKNGNEEP